MKSIYRFIVFVTLSILPDVLIFEHADDLTVIVLTGVLFGLSIALAVKSPMLQGMFFVFLSIAVFLFSLFILNLGVVPYWGINHTFVVAAPIIGTVLEILNFAIVYRATSSLKIRHFVIGPLAGTILVMPVLFDDAIDVNAEKYFWWAGYIIWYYGVAYILYDINRLKKANSLKVNNMPNQQDGVSE